MRFWSLFAFTLFSCSGSLSAQSLQSQEDRILASVGKAEWQFVFENQLEKGDDSYKQLIASMIKVENDKPLSKEEIIQLREIGNGSDNGFRGLFAYYVLIRANIELSDRALDGLLQTATGPTALIKGDEKKLIAIWVVLRYQDRIRDHKSVNNKTQ